MRILTVRQPWAWAIIHGGKDVENRVRNIAGNYRGPIAIHAALKNDHAAWVALGRTNLTVYTQAMDTRLPLVGGVILGVVNLVDVHHAVPDELGRIRCNDVIDAQGAWGPACSTWAEEATYHLVLANPRPLTTPIPYRGALGLRRLDDATVNQITLQLNPYTEETP